MTTDTDALLATVREALTYRWGTHTPHKLVESERDAIAALDSLAAELERVKAEREREVPGYPPGTSNLEVALTEALQDAETRLDKALAALREIETLDAKSLDDIDFALDEAGEIARAAIAEIEEEA